MVMPSGDILRIVVGGKMGADTWSIGSWRLYSGMTGTPTPAQMNANAAAWLGTFNSLVWSPASGGLKLINQLGVDLSTCTTYMYRAGQLAAQGTASQTAVAGSAGSSHPGYVACAVTTLTNAAGRSKRGRIFIPVQSGTIDANSLQFSGGISTVVTNLASWMATGTDTTLPGSPTGSPIVLSRTTSSTAQITSLRADSIPDTQHGRTNKLVAVSRWTATVT